MKTPSLSARSRQILTLYLRVVYVLRHRTSFRHCEFQQGSADGATNDEPRQRSRQNATAPDLTIQVRFFARLAGEACADGYASSIGTTPCRSHSPNSSAGPEPPRPTENGNLNKGAIFQDNPRKPHAQTRALSTSRESAADGALLAVRHLRPRQDEWGMPPVRGSDTTFLQMVLDGLASGGEGAAPLHPPPGHPPWTRWAIGAQVAWIPVRRGGNQPSNTRLDQILHRHTRWENPDRPPRPCHRQMPRTKTQLSKNRRTQIVRRASPTRRLNTLLVRRHAHSPPESAPGNDARHRPRLNDPPGIPVHRRSPPELPRAINDRLPKKPRSSRSVSSANALSSCGSSDCRSRAKLLACVSQSPNPIVTNRAPASTSRRGRRRPPPQIRLAIQLPDGRRLLPDLQCPVDRIRPQDLDRLRMKPVQLPRQVRRSPSRHPLVQPVPDPEPPDQIVPREPRRQSDPLAAPRLLPPSSPSPDRFAPATGSRMD